MCEDDGKELDRGQDESDPILEPIRHEEVAVDAVTNLMWLTEVVYPLRNEAERGEGIDEDFAWMYGLLGAQALVDTHERRVEDGTVNEFDGSWEEA